MSQVSSQEGTEVLEVVQKWMAKEASDEMLCEQLGVNPDWVDQLHTAVQRYQHHVSSFSTSQVELTPVSVGEEVGAEDEIVVFSDSIKVTRLFTDSERLERKGQEGVVSFDVNGQGTTVAWKRPMVRRIPKTWGPLDDRQTRLLYVGQPKGLLDFDVALLESDEPEREFFQRIADLLQSAGAIFGLVPGAGTTVSAALGLGSAIAKLIKAKIDDDAEMRFLGTLGGRDTPLKYGEYQIRRHAFSDTRPEIVIGIRVEKFEKDSLPKHTTILLDRIDFQPRGSGSIVNLQIEDRIVSDITITRTPDGSGSEEDKKARASSLQIDRPFYGENNANWASTFGLKDKLLYDGPWGINLALTANMSGIPREINNEEWMAVIAQTGGLVESLVPKDEKESVRRGFKIAETVRSNVIKYLPKTRFSASLSTLLFVGTPISGIHALSDSSGWQQVDLDLTLGNYGVVTFRLNILLSS